MYSIRRRMLILLLTTFFVVWAVALAYTTHNTRERVEDGADGQSIQGANYLWLRAKRALDSGEDVPAVLAETMRSFSRFESLAFQVWDGETLLIKTTNAPDFRMAQRPGFQNGMLDGTVWRFYYRVDAFEGLDVIVAREDEFSGDLAEVIAFNTMWPMLLAMPLLGIAIFFGVNRGLKPLRQLAAQITERSPTQMAPIEPANVPVEVKGIVTSLNSLLNRLDTAMESERRFTANASHELRTPLAAIKVQSQVAMRSNDDTERQEALGQIERSVGRATRLVGQLLTLSRLDPDTAHELLKKIDLRPVVEEEFASISEVALKKNIDIALDAPDKIEILGDAGALSILVRNLLDNAVRYTPENGTVTATIGRERNGVRLCVCDSGPGIPVEERQKVFERFYRMVGSASSGAGLGLSIVRRIVEFHQADLSLDDTPNGSGLMVSILFPRKKI